MTFTLIDVIKTINIVKKIKPESKLVLGGPHVSIYPKETINIKGVDFVVLGEGEKIFAKLIDNIDNFEKLKEIKGLVYKNKDGTIVHTGLPGLIPENELDKLPFPKRELTPYKKYTSILAKRTPITTLFTSRGCPYKCSFCNRPHLGNIFRICKLIIKKELDIGFDIRARVDTLDEELLQLLKKAGCRGIHYGIEAGTEKILKVLRKGITLQKAKEIFELTRKYKIQTLAYFMIGSPNETIEDIFETFRVSKWLKPDFVHMTILTPFPATDIYFQALSKGVFKNDVWKEFAKNPDENFEPPCWEENFTRQELEKLLIKGYKTFYTRPSYIIKNLFKIRSFGEFKRKTKAGIKVIFMK